MGFFSKLFGTEPKIETKTVVDPLKQGVANPLSSFLSGQVGAGVPRYEGPLGAELPQGGGASVSPFLSKSVDDIFGQISDTAMKSFKNSYSDILENSAGALSSSGRAYNDMTATTNLSLGLADKRAALELGLPAAQYDIASKMQTQTRENQVLVYNDWMKSLPQYNPVLDKAINFLNGTTSTGTDILSALNPGSSGLIGDLIKAAGTIVAAGVKK